MAAERKTLTQLSVPICLETLFYMLSGMVDTLMLSSVSDQAVGAVGTANTYIGVFIIMFGVISSGMVAVMSQNIGAGRPGIAYQARQLGLMFNALIGVLMSVILAFFSGGILRMVSIAPALLEPAETYLRIVGGACFLNALIPIFSSYLRVFGYTKHSLIGTSRNIHSVRIHLIHKTDYKCHRYIIERCFKCGRKAYPDNLSQYPSCRNALRILLCLNKHSPHNSYNDKIYNP